MDVNLKSGWLGAIQQLAQEVDKLKEELAEEQKARSKADDALASKITSLKSASS